jgi:SET domain
MHGTTLRPGIEVRATPHGRSLFATRPIPAGRPILPLVGRPRPKPDRLTVQIGPDLDLAPDGASWALSNHACRPSCRVDFETWCLTSLRAVNAGEELTWNYLTTEWERAAPFACGCGVPGCRGAIRGFRHLTEAQRRSLTAPVSPALAYLLARAEPLRGAAA